MRSIVSDANLKARSTLTNKVHVSVLCWHILIHLTIRKQLNILSFKLKVLQIQLLQKTDRTISDRCLAKTCLFRKTP